MDTLNSLTVIFTTYNSPEWLEKVLWGFSYQSYKAFKIIVADDGSSQETAALINRMRDQTGLEIKHVRHRDDGFRKCRILNKAIIHAETEYLVFTDGDCIPRSDFLSVHAKNAEKGHYVSGSYYRLPMETSEAIQREDIESGRCFELKWLRAHGLPRSQKTIKLTATERQARFLNRFTFTNCIFRGSNASAWRDDIIAVNGFEERMQYGGLDRELGVRLVNLGVKPRHVRYNAICLHLDHPRGYKDPTLVAKNRALRIHNEKHGVTQADHGIQRLIEAGYQSKDHCAESIDQSAHRE